MLNARGFSLYDEVGGLKYLLVHKSFGKTSSCGRCDRWVCCPEFHHFQPAAAQGPWLCPSVVLLAAHRPRLFGSSSCAFVLLFSLVSRATPQPLDVILAETPRGWGEVSVSSSRPLCCSAVPSGWRIGLELGCCFGFGRRVGLGIGFVVLARRGHFS